MAVAAPIPAAAAGSDDYPYRGSVGAVDPWGFYTGFCNSFVVWRLNQAGIHFRGATLSGPNGRSRFFGNAWTWDAAAREIGFTVDTVPAPGAVAVWHGGEGGAWPTGHVAYVMAVDGAGRAILEEYNWSVRFGYGIRTGQAPRYIHFVNQPAPRPAPAPAPAAHQFQTSDTLRARSGPGTTFAVLRLIPEGAAIQVVCQTRSASVINGSGIWDRLIDGSFVTDYYTTTPAFNDFSPGIAHC